MLDAGPLVDFNRVRQTKQAYELPYHGFGEPGRLPHVVQATEFNANQWVDEKEVPYTHDPNMPFNWVRVRMIGGKSLFWARMSFRLSGAVLFTRRADFPRHRPQRRSEATSRRCFY